MDAFYRICFYLYDLDKFFKPSLYSKPNLDVVLIFFFFKLRGQILDSAKMWTQSQKG